MRDILAEIVEKKRAIVADAKKRRPLDELKENLPCGTFRMAEHFRWRGWGLIAECKLQSPAKGRLTTSHSVLELADIYTAAGAAVLSVLTGYVVQTQLLGKEKRDAYLEYASAILTQS